MGAQLPHLSVYTMALFLKFLFLLETLGVVLRDQWIPSQDYSSIMDVLVGSGERLSLASWTYQEGAPGIRDSFIFHRSRKVVRPPARMFIARKFVPQFEVSFLYITHHASDWLVLFQIIFVTVWERLSVCFHSSLFLGLVFTFLSVSELSVYRELCSFSASLCS